MLDKIKTPLKLKNPDLLREQSYVNGEWVSAADATRGGRVEIHDSVAVTA